MIGANGRCKKHGNQFMKESSNICLGKKDKNGQYILQKRKCIQCKQFERVQTSAIVNSHLKCRCVYECEHFAGFYNDHTQWIDCNVKGTSCRYFSDDPYSLKDICPNSKDKRWIGFCKDFKQKQHPRLPRFETISVKGEL